MHFAEIAYALAAGGLVCFIAALAATLLARPSGPLGDGRGKARDHFF
jgi:hypothetical protein